MPVKPNKLTEDMNMKKLVLCLMTALMVFAAQSVVAASTKGLGSAIPAYYDHDLLTILFVEFSPAAEKSLIQHNQSLNFIYQSDPGLPGGQPFISVIDAIPGDGFNPVWQEVQIEFTADNTPRQLFSDDEIADAVASGEITLTFTDEVYWCPVIGKK